MINLHLGPFSTTWNEKIYLYVHKKTSRLEVSKMLMRIDNVFYAMCLRFSSQWKHFLQVFFYLNHISAMSLSLVMPLHSFRFSGILRSLVHDWCCLQSPRNSAARIYYFLSIPATLLLFKRCFSSST